MILDDQIHPVHETDRDQLVEVWAAAVRATHDFLSEADIRTFRPYVRDVVGRLQLACMRDAAGDLIAFVGVDRERIEALFVHPLWRGAGIGRRLLEFAIEELGTTEVDVNEQNQQAVGFYLRMGFAVEGRSARDGLGKPFPLLHMRLRR